MLKVQASVARSTTILDGMWGRLASFILLTLDTDLSGDELEAVRKEIFTNPVTQDSGFQPLAKGFDWAIWVGFRPGVRDTAGSVALEAISDYLGRPLSSRRCGLHLHPLHLERYLSRSGAGRDHCAGVAGKRHHSAMAGFLRFGVGCEPRDRADPAQSRPGAHALGGRNPHRLR